MATKFLEPGGDADFQATATNGFWSSDFSSSVKTDFVHGNHIKSIGYNPGGIGTVEKASILTDSGSRISCYFYINTLPTATDSILNLYTGGLTIVARIRLTNTGV